MNKEVECFLEHLEFEKNVSPHTLRNYMSDLKQFQTYLEKERKVQEV